jgi:hypothetical protein
MSSDSSTPTRVLRFLVNGKEFANSIEPDYRDLVEPLPASEMVDDASRISISMHHAYEENCRHIIRLFLTVANEAMNHFAFVYENCFYVVKLLGDNYDVGTIHISSSPGKRNLFIMNKNGNTLSTDTTFDVDGWIIDLTPTQRRMLLEVFDTIIQTKKIAFEVHIRQEQPSIVCVHKLSIDGELLITSLSTPKCDNDDSTHESDNGDSTYEGDNGDSTPEPPMHRRRLR